MNKPPLYEYKMKVRDYECDAQGIVNNANYQHYYEVMRHEFFEVNGIPFYDLHQKGIDAVIVSAYIRYSHSLHGGNEFLCTVDSLERDGIRYIFNQKIVRLKDNKVCSTGKFEVVCLYDGKLSKPKALDEAFNKYF